MKLYPYLDKMLPLPEVRRLTGLSRGGIECRLADGIPLDAPKLKARYDRYFVGNKWRTVRDVARFVGVHQACIRERIRLGEPIDEPMKPGERPYETDNKKPSDVGLKLPNITDDNLTFDQDKRAQLVRRYFANKAPIHTDEEIRAEFADFLPQLGISELSDLAVSRIREWLREEMFCHRKVGEGEQLELIGDIMGLSREAIRLDEMSGRKAALQWYRRQGMESEMRAELRERDSERNISYADFADLMSPGSFDAEYSGKPERHNEHTLSKRLRNERRAKKTRAA